MVKRPCVASGCPNYTERTRCSLHERAKQARRDAIRGTPSARGYDSEYRADRAKVLALGYPCVYCGGTATTVDHRIALAAGGTSDLDNLVPACVSCNSQRGAKLGNARRWR